MIQLSPLTFSFLLEAVILLAAACAGMAWYIRRQRRRLRDATAAAAARQAGEAANVDVRHYLQTELKLTEGRHDTLFGEESREQVELTERDWLRLRQGYLVLELELAADKTRDDDFWTRFGQAMRRLLLERKLVKRLDLGDISELAEKEKEKEAEHEELASMMELMQEEARELEEVLAGLGEDEGEGSLAEKLQRVARSHREMAHCVFVLEDENKLLREQIRALLEADQGGGGS